MSTTIILAFAASLASPERDWPLPVRIRPAYTEVVSRPDGTISYHCVVKAAGPRVELWIDGEKVADVKNDGKWQVLKGDAPVGAGGVFGDIEVRSGGASLRHKARVSVRE